LWSLLRYYTFGLSLYKHQPLYVSQDFRIYITALSSLSRIYHHNYCSSIKVRQMSKNYTGIHNYRELSSVQH